MSSGLIWENSEYMLIKSNNKNRPFKDDWLEKYAFQVQTMSHLFRFSGTSQSKTA